MFQKDLSEYGNNKEVNDIVLCLVAQSCPTHCNPTDYSLPGSSAMDAPGKNIGVGFHAQLQWIFPTQELNPGLLHYRRVLYRLGHQELHDIKLQIKTNQPMNSEVNLPSAWDWASVFDII